jgi:hypothetical protein
MATLQGLLADNTTNDITAQDLRDCLVSAAPNAGQLYVTSSAATTVGSSGVYYEAAGTWALGSAARNFTRQADNRLRYDGAPTQLALVVAHFTLECGSSSQSCRVAITKNGSVVAGGDQKVYLGTTGSAPGQGCVVALTTVATNDYLGLWVRNDTAANNLTLAFANLVVLGLLN